MESATAHSLFHKVKFPLHKAFMMLYLISTGKDQNSIGRSKGTKKLVVIGLERNNRGITKAYARQIENAGVKQLKPFFDDISQEKPR